MIASAQLGPFGSSEIANRARKVSRFRSTRTGMEMLNMKGDK